MAIADGVAGLVFGDIHDVAADGADGGGAAGAGSAGVLKLLVVGFPAPFEGGAGVAPLLSEEQESVHAVPGDVALESKPCLEGEQGGERHDRQQACRENSPVP